MTLSKVIWILIFVFTLFAIFLFANRFLNPKTSSVRSKIDTIWVTVYKQPIAKDFEIVLRGEPARDTFDQLISNTVPMLIETGREPVIGLTVLDNEKNVIGDYTFHSPEGSIALEEYETIVKRLEAMNSNTAMKFDQNLPMAKKRFQRMLKD